MMFAGGASHRPPAHCHFASDLEIGFGHCLFAPKSELDFHILDFESFPGNH